MRRRFSSQPAPAPNALRTRLAAGFAVLAVAATSACTPAVGTPAESVKPPVLPAEAAAAKVATLSDEDLVGQVLMPYAYGDDATQVSTGSKQGNQKIGGVDTPAELITKYRLGGVILVSQSADDPTQTTNPTTNVDSGGQVRRLTDGLRAAAAELPAEVPFLVGTDQEYGAVTRIKQGIVQLPGPMAFGAANNPELTEKAWIAAGTELHAAGVDIDFAPVADVLGARGSEVIGSRAFGTDPAMVSAQVAAAVRGLRAGGVAATLKHFPGHGHVTGDSHTTLPVLTQDRKALAAGDFPPFQAGIAAGAELVMSGWLDAKAIDPGVPAGFSRKVLTDVLRGELKFTGVVVTDALNMDPAKIYPPGEAAWRALAAGNDLLLMPPDLDAAVAGILAAVKSGELPRDRLVDAARRVLTLKYTLAQRQRESASTLDSPAHQATARAVAEAAVTVLAGPCSGPLVTGPIRITASPGREKQREWLTAALTRAGADLTATGGSVIHLIGYKDELADLDQNAAVTISMDVPTLLGSVKSPVKLVIYSSARVSLEAAADVIMGTRKAPGKSPLAVAGLPRSACAS